MEYVTLDKDSNKVFHRTYNIFLTKIENTYNCDEVEDIEIVLKGVKRGKSDSSRYYIRFVMKNKEKIHFGQSSTFNSIRLKVKDKPFK